ncbi:50S ribosomal protein L18e [Candidatus Pacearchaeota archaeon CG_4_9_14_3_um_filter_31_7]|nr:MAG: hypothetical protein AUJ10_03255 [Candidatus Pacearchaeota archaeon CG1_02_31_27]PIN92423.1 MAG: 50S ribosomal protein L18e [Candidatus Pacearchaeota archaeon CG10_big_fil_rev_8_21_14_0_10_31_59]PIZ81008.1 MAG: 50S ribosomal protein L18e [Candidatus Pacearchaeota archaeon CG_4_10_14_0_2_um_filter_31_10]PJA70505.1 MAG: 50S ribosomal protein L18e [Candidatus Pacearchaeota archaeon CG_4_9_14_3_um_filter_31_7]
MRKISKTRVEKKIKKKTKLDFRELIIKLKKQKSVFWIKVADLLSNTNKNKIVINLGQINKKAKEKDIVLIPGKVLAGGVIDKKIIISAYKFSSEALKKLKENKIEMILIEDLIKKNPKGENIKIIR